MKIYLAGRYQRRVEFLGYAKELREMGHEVVSRWVDGIHDCDDEKLTPEQAERFAMDDVRDLMLADTLVYFCEADPELQRGRGGRVWELGFFTGLCVALEGLDRMENASIVLVGGPEENIFTHLPCYKTTKPIESYTDFCKLFMALERGEV